MSARVRSQSTDASQASRWVLTYAGQPGQTRQRSSCRSRRSNNCRNAGLGFVIAGAERICYMTYYTYCFSL